MARREDNRLIIPNANEEDIGEYECQDINNRIHRFELFLSVQSTTPQEIVEDIYEGEVVEEVEEKEDIYDKTPQKRKRVGKLNGKVRLSCGRFNQEVKWSRVNGVRSNTP